MSSQRAFVLLIGVLALSVVAIPARAGNLTGNVTGTGLTGSAPFVISVDPFSGSAATGYTFAVPPGRAGMQPDLTIAYNSGALEQGPLGRGWTFSFPHIQRSTRDGQPKFGAMDVFAIRWNGGIIDLYKRCDPSMPGTPCASGGFSEFRTQTETFMRIRGYGAAPTFSRWEVEDGKGNRHFFGQDEGTGIAAQVGNFRWNLNRVEDAHGNFLTVTWFVDANTLYPKEIRYAGHRAGAAVDLQPTNGVEFGYEGRSDVVPGRLGVTSELRYRLRRVKTWTGSPFQSAAVYLIDYTTPTTGTHPIDLCSTSGCAINTVTCPNGNPSSCSTCDPDTGFCGTCTPVCMNCTGVTCPASVRFCNDGTTRECSNTCIESSGTCTTCVPERCREPGGCGGAGSASPDAPVPCGSVAPVEPASASGFTAAAVVFSAADEASLLARITRHDGAGTTSLPSTTFAYLTDDPAAKAWGAPIADVPVSFLFKESTGTGRNTDDHGVQIEDVNRDGLPDIVRGFGNNCSAIQPVRQVYLNNGTTWTAAPAGLWVLPEDFVVHDCDHEEYDTGLRLVDISGDGFVDLVRAQIGPNDVPSTAVWIGTGSGWRPPLPGEQWSVPTQFVKIDSSGTRGLHSDDRGVRFGDVNGDGLVDLVQGLDFSKGTDAFQVYLNRRGQGWTAESGLKPPVGFVFKRVNGEAVDNGARLLDIDGDGLADIVRSARWEGASQKGVWLGAGSSFQAVTDWDLPEWFVDATNITDSTSGNEDADDLGVRFADVNGDGRVDLIAAREWEGTTPACGATVATCRRVLIHRAGKGWVEDPAWTAALPAGYYFMEHRSENEDYDDGVRLADLDGNGTVDLIRAIDGFRGGPLERRLNADGFSEILREIDNGIGGRTTLAYAPSTAFPAGRGGINGLGFVLPVVVERTVRDGVSTAVQTTTYAYEGGFYHPERREFRGFRHVRTRLPGGSIDLEQIFYQDRGRQIAPLIGSIERQALRNPDDGTLFSLTVNRFNTIDAGPTYFHYLDLTDQYLFDWSTSEDIETAEGQSFEKQVRTTYAFTRGAAPERFITFRQTRMEGDTSTPQDDQFLNEDLFNDAASWRVGFLRRKHVPGGPAGRLSETFFFYDEQPWDAPSMPGPGDPTRIEESDLSQPTPGATGNRAFIYDYDDYGNLILSKDPGFTGVNDQHQTVFEYGVFDATRTFLDRAKITTTGGGSAVDHLSEFRHDARFGATTQVTTPSDGDRHYAYDDFGRLTKTWWSANGTTSFPLTCYQYDLAARPVTVTRFTRDSIFDGDACGSNGMLGTVAFFDGLLRRIQTKTESAEAATPSQVIETVAFDDEGRPLRSWGPFYASGPLAAHVPVPPSSTPAVEFRYDRVGRLDATILPGPRVVKSSYDGWTRTDHEIRLGTDVGPDRPQLQTEMGAFGRVVERRTYDPASGLGAPPITVTRFGYDGLGRIVTITDSGANVLRYEYDPFGQVTATEDPDAGRIEREYYKDGTLKLIRDVEQRETIFAHDELHRVLRKTRHDGSVVTYAYDEAIGRPFGRTPVGHATSMADSSTAGRREFRYDNNGRLYETRTVVDGTAYDIRQELDPMGRPMRLNYPDGYFVDYRYGTGGRIRAVLGPGTTFVGDIRYTPTGDIDSISYGNGTSIDNEFDPATASVTRTLAIAAQSGTTLLDLAFDHTDSGHIESITDRTDPQHPAAQTFELDALYRLRRATALATYGDREYLHDPLGNLTLKDGVSFTYGTGPGAKPHRALSTDSGLSFAYYPDGSLKDVSNSTDGTTRSFAYSADGMLRLATETQDEVTLAVTEYTYDPLGSLVKRVEDRDPISRTTIRISDLYEETNGVGRRYVYLGSQRIAVADEVSGVFYFVGDQVGSLSVVTDSAGSLVERVSYTPFGEVAGMSGADFSGGFRFAGARWDEVAELYDFGARFYDPSLGRFLSIDPVLGNPLDPRGLNPYGYALGNPVTYADLGGYVNWHSVAKAAIAVALVAASDGGIDPATAYSIADATVDGYEDAGEQGRDPFVGAIVAGGAQYAGHQIGAKVGGAVGSKIVEKATETAVRESIKAFYFEGGARGVIKETFKASGGALLDQAGKQSSDGDEKQDPGSRAARAKFAIDKAREYLKRQYDQALTRAERFYLREDSRPSTIPPTVALGDPALMQGSRAPGAAGASQGGGPGAATNAGALFLRAGAFDPFGSGIEAIPDLLSLQPRSRMALERALAASITAAVLGSRSGVLAPADGGFFCGAATLQPDNAGVPTLLLGGDNLMRASETQAP
jgi:RHS repeat-associated protein